MVWSRWPNLQNVTENPHIKNTERNFLILTRGLETNSQSKPGYKGSFPLFFPFLSSFSFSWPCPVTKLHTYRGPLECKNVGDTSNKRKLERGSRFYMNRYKSQAEPQVLKYKTNPKKGCKASEPELEYKTLPESDW